MQNQYTIEYLDARDYYLWDDFVRLAEHGTPFHHSKWIGTMNAVKNIPTRIMVCRNKNRDITAGCAFGYKKKYGLSVFVPPKVTPYYGFVIKDRGTRYASKNEHHLFSVIRFMLEHMHRNYHYMDAVFPPSFRDIRPFTWENFRAGILYTYHAALSDVAGLTDNFDSDIKRRIKKAGELDYDIKTGMNKQLVESYYDLQERTFQRQGHVFQLSKKEFTDFVFTLGQEWIDIYTVFYESKPVFSQILIKEGDRAYYWLAAGDPDYYHTGLNQLLFSHMLEDLKRKGIQQFDFCGANTGSISKYKATYNFNLMNYYHIKKTNGTFARLLFGLKNLMQK